MLTSQVRPLLALLRKYSLDYFRTNWDYYAERLERHGLYYGSRPIPELGSIELGFPSLGRHIVPISVVAFFAIRAIVSLLVPAATSTPIARLVLFIGVVPHFVRAMLEILFVAWSSLQLFTSALEVSRRSLADFEHLVILVVAKHGRIEPQDLGLNEGAFVRLERFRSRSLRLTWWLIAVITGFGVVVFLITATVEGAFKVSCPLVIAWLVIFAPYVFYICYSAYAMPTLLVLVIKYLDLKQAALLDQLRCLNDHLVRLLQRPDRLSHKEISHQHVHISRRLRTLSRQNVHLAGEIDHFSGRFWGHYLNGLLLIFSILLAYLTYLVFLAQDMPFYGRILFTLILAAHTAFLVLVLVFASVLPRNSRRYYKQLLELHHLGKRLMLFNLRDLIRLEVITENGHGRPSGFRLTNGYLIESGTFVLVAEYISMFFFLIFS